MKDGRSWRQEMIRTIRIRDLERDYNLKMMGNYYDFRFGNDCPKGYTLYKIQDKDESVSYQLGNNHQLYYRVKTCL